MLNILSLTLILLILGLVFLMVADLLDFDLDFLPLFGVVDFCFEDIFMAIKVICSRQNKTLSYSIFYSMVVTSGGHSG